MPLNKLSGIALVIATTASVLCGATRTWIGGKNTKISNVNYMLASTPANWSEGEAPVDGDDIVFDSTGAANDCRWDINVNPASWTQTADYVKTVTFTTTYGDSFPFFEVAGNVTLNGGKWKHLANSETNRVYRLWVKIGGDLEVGAGAKISAEACGYQYPLVFDPADYSLAKSKMIGGNHAGYGGCRETQYPPSMLPYGNACAPVEPGGGGNGRRGGGAIRLDVGGDLVVNGLIDANGEVRDFYPGAGGSVYIHANTISGSGSITADSHSTQGTYADGSGGRIAIILTGTGADFSSFDPLTQCSVQSLHDTVKSGYLYYGPSGTVYAEKPADNGAGWLIIKGNGKKASNYDVSNMTAPVGYNGGEATFGRVTVTNNIQMCVNEGASVDISSASMELADNNGHTNTIVLAGGELTLPGNGHITFPLKAIKGLGGLVADTLTVEPSGSLTISEEDGSPFSGDIVVAAGAKVIADKRLAVTGDLTVNGVITRNGPATSTTVPDPLECVVGGDMTVNAGGSIDVVGKGYAVRVKTPVGQPIEGSNVNNGTSHGGWGWNNGFTVSCGTVPFGSITEPAMGGCCADSFSGGGICKLTVAGHLTNNGAITAAGQSGITYYAATGGSVNIRAGSISGSGSIDANASTPSRGDDYGSSGGGRVAVRLTDSNADFSNFTGPITAYASYKPGGSTTNKTGGAGTVWLRNGNDNDSEGTLIIANAPAVRTTWNSTPIYTKYMSPDNTFKNVYIEKSSRLRLMEGKELNVSGIFSNRGQFTADTDSTVNFTGSGAGAIRGDVSFVNFNAIAPGKTITVEDDKTISISGIASISGAVGNLLTMRAENGGDWNLAVTGSVVIEAVALGGCQSSVPLTVINGTDLGGNSANITFVNIAAGELITWTGLTDSDWTKPGNWDRARTPIATDKILIPSDATVMPAVSVDVTAAELTVQSGATLSIGDRKFTIAGNAAIAGGLITDGAAVFEVAGNLSMVNFVPSTSTVRLNGTAAQNVTFANTSLNNFEVLSPAVNLSGDFSAGKFVIGNGTDAFDIAFAKGESVEAAEFVATASPSAKNGRLRCAESGEQWLLNVSQATLSGISVSGSDASNGVAIVPTNSADLGDNVNWLFVDNRSHWNGSAWSAGNPSAAVDCVLDADTSLTLSSSTEMKSLTVGPRATLTVRCDLGVLGAVVLEPNATLVWDQPGVIGGNLVILNGASLTHTKNAVGVDDPEMYKLDVTVGGSCTIAEGGSVDVCGKGYATQYGGPGSPRYGHKNDGTLNFSGSVGASHGGRAYSNGTHLNTAAPCYGSILTPTNCGSCASYAQYPGGGAARLAVTGRLNLKGEINADALTGADYYSSAGGSIWVTAADIVGQGSIHANGGNGTHTRHGGGGRIALYLTQATSLANFTGEIHTYGGRNVDSFVTYGSPGTYYLQTAADSARSGTLLVANCHGMADLSGYNENCNQTDLPSVVDATETSKTAVYGKDYATIALHGDTTVRDIHLLDTSSKLKLNGYTLKVRSRYHEISPNDGAQVILGGGEIKWSRPGTVLMVW